MKYYMIAGEASGDLHGSNLVKQIIKRDADADIRCWGGDLMQEAGATLVKHYRELAFMGFAEVIKNLGTIFRNLSFCKKDILSYQPDVIILIDYPGFNLRIAKWAHKKGLKVVYYISPQIWAWKENRVKSIQTSVDKMLVILPFEKDFYKKWNYEVEYTGHPLVSVIKDFKDSHSTNDFSIKPIVALLPGSRKQEILKKLPVMLQAAAAFPQYQFILAKAPGQEDAFYDELLAGHSNVSSVRNQTYHLLSAATAALVTSGTATLETALFGVPQIVCYKGSSISYQIARRVIKVKYISLVNLIMNKEVVKELIQDQMNEKNIIHELTQILNNEERINEIKKDYAALNNILMQDEDASVIAAAAIIGFLNES
jgi:lipid-A-disaccharide synthase